MASPWNDDANVRRLKELLEAGMSYSAIGKELGGLSKNAVYSKVKRSDDLRSRIPEPTSLVLGKFKPNPAQPKAEPLPRGAKTLPPLPSLMGADLKQ